jgi:exosortase B
MPTRPAAPAWLPARFDMVAFAWVAVGFLSMYGPTYWSLAHTIWASDEQGHGPIILAVSAWLLFQKRHELAALDGRSSSPVLGGVVLCIGLLLHVLGRSQAIIMFEGGSQIAVLAGLLLLFKGARAIRLAWFPLFFLLFMVPLPSILVGAATGPLKSAVSAVASSLLHDLGYPVGRSGVILTVGQYQLLVADACAGLNSMFTLEALGLIYMNLMNYTSAARNLALALLLVPISFVANIVRVVILVLVTYHFGDAAGRGFVHGFAGMVLFMVALITMLIVDKLLNLAFKVDRRTH